MVIHANVITHKVPVDAIPPSLLLVQQQVRGFARGRTVLLSDTSKKKGILPYRAQKLAISCHD